MVGRHNYLLQIQSLSWMSTLLRISSGKKHSIMPSCRHHALFMFIHIHLLDGISEKKQKQQTVISLKEASRRGLNFGQLIKHIQQILNKLFFQIILRTIWKAGSTITGRQSKRMQKAHSQRAAWQEVTVNTQIVLFLFSSTRKKTKPSHRICLLTSLSMYLKSGELQTSETWSWSCWSYPSKSCSSAAQSSLPLNPGILKEIKSWFLQVHESYP